MYFIPSENSWLSQLNKVKTYIDNNEDRPTYYKCKTKEDKEIVNSYKGRKDSAEKLVLEKLKDDMWRNFFLSKQKRSDLADSFLMSLRLD